MTRLRPLILASQSPQRRRLLKELRVPFRIVRPNIRERMLGKSPRDIVMKLAMRKARSVAKKHPHALILGADTVVACRGRMIGKPKNRKDALGILSVLNGRWQRVYTGIALIDSNSGKAWKSVAVSRVKARKLGDDALRRLAGKHLDKAGAYALQDHGDPFVEEVVGPTDNVVGLPLSTVRDLMRKAAARK